MCRCHFIQHAAVTAIDALVARLQSIDSNDEITSDLGTFKNLPVRHSLNAVVFRSRHQST